MIGLLQLLGSSTAVGLVTIAYYAVEIWQALRAKGERKERLRGVRAAVKARKAKR